MFIPEGKTKEEVEEAMLRVARRLAPNFKFGYFTVEDIIQQACLFACECLPRYDPSRPLDSFLFSHVRNRLINYKRDNYKRTDCPCKLCYGQLPGFTKHEDGMQCEKFKIWHKRNLRKQNVILPLDIGNIRDESEPRTRTESTAAVEAETAEILEKIDIELPVELRVYYLLMKEGLSVPKSKRNEVEAAVALILNGELNEYAS